MQSKIKHLHSKNIEKNHASHIECNSTVNHDLLYQKMSSKNKISAWIIHATLLQGKISGILIY